MGAKGFVLTSSMKPSRTEGSSMIGCSKMNQK